MDGSHNVSYVHHYTNNSKSFQDLNGACAYSPYEMWNSRSTHSRECSSETPIHNGMAIDNQRKIDTKIVVIIGTGDFGRALLVCLVRFGYRVVVGSRNLERNRSRIVRIGGEIEPIETAVTRSDVIVVAIPYEGFATLDPKLFSKKIVIDVSNRSLDYDPSATTLALRLQQLLPQSKVVKAFNTLSAYALENGVNQGSKQVPICSNDEKSKAVVSSLARNVGFVPVDFGCLSNAKSVEDIPWAFFPEWKFPTLYASVVFTIFFMIALFRKQLCPNFGTSEWDWSLFVRVPVHNLQTSLGLTSLTMLASCYFPGVVAAYLQLYRRSKYSTFPNWLDVWLKRRKQLGLMALLLVMPHFILAIVDIATDSWILMWEDSLYFACGVLAVTCMTILGVTSLPSVAGNLTWREFSFVQRYFGWLCLTLSTLHVLFIYGKEIVENKFTCIFLPGGAQIATILPVLTILFKLPLLLPCLDSKVQKIRRGQGEARK